MTATTAEPAPVVQRFAHALLSLDEILHESGTRAEKPLDVRVALTLRIRDRRLAAITGYISDVDAYDSYLNDSPREKREVPSPDVTAPDTQAARHGHDGAKNAAVSSRSTGLRAALLRRPRFDEEGALQATRLERAVRKPAGGRT